MRIWYIYYSPWNWHERNLYLPKEMIAVWKGAGHRANLANVDRLSLVRAINEKDAKCDVAFIHDWQTVEAAERAGLNIVKRSKFRVLIVGGGWRRPEWVRKSLRAVQEMKVNLVCLTQRVHYDKFKRAHNKVFHVGLGFSPEVFYPDWDREKSGILFYGDKGSGRDRRLGLLKKEFPGQTKFDVSCRVPHMDTAEAMRGAAIGWNQIDRGPEEHGIAENLRIWETIGGGLFLFCSRSKHIPLKRGVQYVDWKDDKTMIEGARYYLDHPDEREEIAKAGWEVSRKHTWDHRAREYKALVEAHL